MNQGILAVEARGLVKVFGDNRALDGVDLVVPAGSIWAARAKRSRQDHDKQYSGDTAELGRRDRVNIWSMRHASTQTTERYYCRAKAGPAFARVNEAYKTMFQREPAIKRENV